MKKFLICLSLLCSFLFIGNVRAISSEYYDMSQWVDISEFTLPSGINTDTYYIAITKYASNSYMMTAFSKANSNYKFYNTSNTTFPSCTIKWLNSSNNAFTLTYYLAENSKTFRAVGSANQFASGTLVYTNKDILNKTRTDLWFDLTKVNFISTYTVNFHLNSGNVWDLSNMLNPNFIEEDYSIETTTEELEDYLTHITPLKNNYTFIGWYYDEYFTQPYNSNNILDDNINLYAKWIENPNITFHLNGGYIKFGQSENEEENNNSQHGGGGRHDDEYLTEDFTRQFNSSNEAHDFITSFTIHKSSMQFAGFYYDINFRTPYNPNDNLEGNIEIYAKWRYENVEDFLNTTTFNSYTFDTNYQYAIITRGENTGDIYLGLNVNRYDITVYQYDENINDYHNSNEFCLIPMYSKNSNYYYLLNDTMNDYINVLVLPKETFDNNNYNFLLSDNAYVTYTDNLDNAIIYDSNGEEVNTNLSERYNTLQENLINDEKDLLTIFKNLLNFKDNRVLFNINTVWNKLKATPIYIYLMILIVGGLIILIIKSARRN